jgi:hypothetical protein
MPKHYLVPLSLVILLVSGCLILLGSAAVGSVESARTIRIWDGCDPDTFNQAIGPGTCMPGNHARETFPLFIEELTLDHIAGAWRFGSTKFTLPDGRNTVLNNRGGETHTFTRVVKFGGGFVPILNQLSGNPVPAPECLQPPSDTSIFVPGQHSVPGPTAGSSAMPAGVSRFQCCIHPWMRTTVVVKEDGTMSSAHE